MHDRPLLDGGVALSDQQINSLARDAIQRASAGDFAAAEPMFARVVDARPNSGQALHLLGQVRLKLGRFAEAREPLERAAQFLPKEPAAQVNLAGCLSVLGAHAEALAALERAIKLAPDNAAIAHNRGRALEALGRADEAEQAYTAALSIDHRLMPALSARATLLAARGDWAGALSDLDMALTSRPDDAQLRLRRGELLLHQGDWMRGLDDYDARLELPEHGHPRWAPGLPRWQGERLDGRLLVYPEQDNIESDAAMRDTLMLARLPGIDAAIQCSFKVAGWLNLPTVRRGDPLDGFAAAIPLRSLPKVLDWTLQTIPSPPPLHLKAEADERPAGAPVGWFSTSDPPPDVAVERDPEHVARCRLVVGDDHAPTHLAAILGIPTLIRLPHSADWLWGPQRGPSPWYRSVETLGGDAAEALVARLARC
jgi:tetratricopeptide (TPR) repeat protein